MTDTTWGHLSSFQAQTPSERLHLGRPFDPAVQERNRGIIAKAADRTPFELAEEFNVGIGTVRSVLGAAGVSAKRASRPSPEVIRNSKWCEMYVAGSTATAIAEEYGVSRERVCQILRKENLITRKAQRRRLAQELVDADRAAVNADRAELEQKVIEIVRAGHSASSAAASLGISSVTAYHICKKLGVESSHGRWRDMSPRIARMRELVAAGNTMTAALKIVEGEEGRRISYSWVHRNCPELCNKHRGATPERPAPRPVIERLPKVVEPPPPDVWTEERTAELIRLWFGGTSAQQVADIFGADFTRNMIIGKIHRLRIAGLLKV